VGWDNFVIIDLDTTDKTIAEMDWRSTPHHAARAGHLPARRRAVPGGALDFENHKAFVRKVEPDYYTTAHDAHQGAGAASTADVRLTPRCPELGWAT
jgi:DEAD/DEAH box helicase domain-containing protein